MASQNKPKKHSKTAVKKRLGLVARVKTTAADLRLRRRASPKRPALPGYISFTRQVFQTLITHKGHFFILLTLYVALATIFVGFVQQNQYQYLNAAVTQFAPEMLGGQLD